MTTFSSNDDIIDVRDVITRVEELREGREHWTSEERPAGVWHVAYPTDAEELENLEGLLSCLAGYGGDEQWEGQWYPVTLIRDSHFTDYARELLEDCGDIPRDLPGCLEIDWDATACNIRIDYSDVEFNGVTYWYR